MAITFSWGGDVRFIPGPSVDDTRSVASFFAFGEIRMNAQSDESTQIKEDAPQPQAAQERRTAGRRATDATDSGAKVDRRCGFDRRRGPGRRRSEERRSAEEGEMNPEQFEFVMALNEYKKVNKRPFPTWTEVLDVIHALGYRKVAEPEDIR